jgi:hypothetical protein
MLIPYGCFEIIKDGFIFSDITLLLSLFPFSAFMSLPKLDEV